MHSPNVISVGDRVRFPLGKGTVAGVEKPRGTVLIRKDGSALDQGFCSEFGKVSKLHHADCPMTNHAKAWRTTCTCAAIEKAGFPGGEPDTPVGGWHGPA